MMVALGYRSGKCRDARAGRMPKATGMSGNGMLGATDLSCLTGLIFKPRSLQNPTGFSSCRPFADRADGSCLAGLALYFC